MAEWLEGPGMVDGHEVCAHIARLREDGWTLKAIADEAGTAPNTLSQWIDGTGRRPLRVKADAVLAVSGPPPQPSASKGGRPRFGGGTSNGLSIAEQSARFDRHAEAHRWLERAECRGMDTALFFPSRGEPAVEAKQACARCPVAAECLDAALADGEHHGVWGGKSERQRRLMRSAARRAAA